MPRGMPGFCFDIDGDWWTGHGPGSGCRYCDPTPCGEPSPYGGQCVKDRDHAAAGSDHWDGEHSWEVL